MTTTTTQRHTSDATRKLDAMRERRDVQEMIDDAIDSYRIVAADMSRADLETAVKANVAAPPKAKAHRSEWEAAYVDHLTVTDTSSTYLRQLEMKVDLERQILKMCETTVARGESWMALMQQVAATGNLGEVMTWLKRQPAAAATDLHRASSAERFLRDVRDGGEIRDVAAAHVRYALGTATSLRDVTVDSNGVDKVAQADAARGMVRMLSTLLSDEVRMVLADI